MMGGAEIGQIKSCYPVKLRFGEAAQPAHSPRRRRRLAAHTVALSSASDSQLLPMRSLPHLGTRESGCGQGSAAKLSSLLGRQTGLSALATLRDLLLEHWRAQASNCIKQAAVPQLPCTGAAWASAPLTPSHELLAPLCTAWPA